jgi:membrane-associated protease RseP (regulator of RpoE activity)
MDFIIYDIIFLVLFVILVSVFLYTKRKNLKKEGLLFLYRTSWGIKVIDYVGKKYKKTLSVLSYFSITLGYLLMIGIIYLVIKLIWLYPRIAEQVRIPPIMPIVPYIDKIVPGLPSFYFFYFIIIIALIAIPHEFAHGIFMRRYNVGIKSTGFGFFPFFLPVFLAAFVEQDEKSLEKAGKFEQMSILSAGTFANLLTAVFFFIIMWLFFSLAYAPQGVVFDDYAYNLVDVSSIVMVNGVQLQNPDYKEIISLINENKTFQEIKTKNQEYVGFKDISSDGKYAYLYYDSPAINARLEKIILEIEGKKITNIEELSEEFHLYNSDEKITLTVMGKDKKPYEVEILLEKNPKTEDAWIGIVFENYKSEGITQKIINFLSSFKKAHIYYETKFEKLGLFIYNLLWWTILISVSVALINMLPVGIFDGGRFFYLTILGITKSKKKAKKCFKFITYLFLLVLLLLMIFWAFSFL